MFSAILPILINIFVLSRVETIPIGNETLCSLSKLGCNCQNIENITRKSVESCCKSELRTLLITGLEVKNISVNITNSPCTNNFETLFIRETGIVNFNMPFYGLSNIVNIYIEKNQNLNNFNKLYFSEMSQKIERIYVEYNSIRSIGPRTFSNLPNITNLKLSDNKIGYIDDRSFSNLTKLSSLSLSNNLLTVLSADMFYGLENLKQLLLFNNFLMELKPNVFQYITNLQYLSLSVNPSAEFSGFGSIPDMVFFHVKRLKVLNMYLKIKNLTSVTFYGLTDLENLDLQNNQLTVIPAGTLQQVPKVAYINLSKNQLSCLLPETFRSLPKLLSLDLNTNDLSFISNEVFADLIHLQFLDLFENNIYVIEKNSFVGLKSLLVFKMNMVQGRAKSEIQNNFRESPLAKLRNTTKIFGMLEYFGISSGANELPEIPTSTVKPTIKEIESKKLICPSAGTRDRVWLDSSQTGSRKYLLIIVGICVVFLLIAFAIIMSYRAWSKRKMSDLSYNIDIQEKQEMLVNNSNSVNGRIDGKSHSKSNATRKSLNGSYMPDSPVEIGETKIDPFASGLSSQQQQQQQQESVQSPAKPIACPSANECSNHSDDESALTPLGVL